METVKLVVITAENANTAIVNRLLLSLRDWEFSAEPEWDDCHIVRTTENRSIESKEVDKPPIQEFPSTEFHGKSFEEVEDMMLSKHKAGAGTSLFLLLDDKGIQDETVIVAERAMNLSEFEVKDLYLDHYNKVRVPWIETHSMWCNLSLANMQFDEFCVEKQGEEKGRWFTYQDMMEEGHYKQFIESRHTVIRELRKLDLA